MTLQWLLEHPDSQEADAFARRFLTRLYEIAAKERGLEIESITIRKKDDTNETVNESTVGAGSARSGDR